MENKRINDDISISCEKDGEKTIITLTDKNKSIVMFDEKTDDYYWAEYRVNEHYVVVFSRGCMMNQIPIYIERAYDIKEGRLVNLNSYTRKVLEDMLICQRFIDSATILAIINNWNVPSEYSKEIDKDIEYLTNGNKDITREQVIDYIFKCYPSLRQFACYPTPSDIYRYKSIRRAIINMIAPGGFAFHIMPQRIDDKTDIKNRKKKESNH